MNRNRLCRMAAPLLAVLMSGVLALAAPEPISEDEQAVRAVIQLYFDGIIKYDEAALRKAFHPEAQVIGVDKDGEIETVPFQEWVLYTRGEAPDPTGRINTIISVDITGAAAVAKTDLNWPRVRYIDYLSLVKGEDGWRIVNKIFHRGAPELR